MLLWPETERGARNVGSARMALSTWENPPLKSRATRRREGRWSTQDLSDARRKEAKVVDGEEERRRATICVDERGEGASCTVSACNLRLRRTASSRWSSVCEKRMMPLEGPEGYSVGCAEDEWFMSSML